MDFDIKTVRSKPAQAVQFRSNLLDQIAAWIGVERYILEKGVFSDSARFELPEGILVVLDGDYILKGDDGKVYTAAEQPFNETFDIVDEELLSIGLHMVDGKPYGSIYGTRVEVEPGIYEEGHWHFEDAFIGRHSVNRLQDEKEWDFNETPTIYDEKQTLPLDGQGGYAFDGRNGG